MKQVIITYHQFLSLYPKSKLNWTIEHMDVDTYLLLIAAGFDLNKEIIFIPDFTKERDEYGRYILTQY